MTDKLPSFSEVSKTILEWLEFKIKKDFNQDVDLGFELIFSDPNNTGQVKIGKTFSENLKNIPRLESYLSNLVDSIMQGEVSLRQMRDDLEI